MNRIYLPSRSRASAFSRAARLALGLLAVFLSGGHVLRVGAMAPGAPEAQAACDVTVRIMPLGDSITKGSSSGVAEEIKMISYRKTLYDNLVGAGYNVDFVGSLNNGSFYTGFDFNHEGHAGYTAGQIATNIYDNGGGNWISINPPDIILLHIGTNGLTTQTNVANVESILNEIDQYEIDSGNTVTVILARIINQVPLNPAVPTFNNAVANIAQQRITNGDLIIPVNMETGAGIVYSFWDDSVNPGDMYYNPISDNGLHPYISGYNKMASVWKINLDPLLQECNHPPVFTSNPGNRSNTENDPVSLDIDATDADGDQLTFSARNLPPGLTINSTSGLISGTLTYQASAGSPYPVQVKVTDDGQLRRSNAASFTWTVTDLNGPPVLTQPSNQTSAEGSSPSLQLSASDPDGDTLSYSASGLPDGLSVNQTTGLISGNVSNDAASNSPYTVSVKVTDNVLPAPLESSASFSWTIHDITPPVITDPGPKSNNEGDQIALPIEAEDADGDTLVYSATGLPPNLAINKDSGLISGVIGPTAAIGSPYTVTLTVLDSGGLSDSLNFQWTVHDITPPVVTNPGPQQDPEGKLVNLQIKANDADGDPLAFSASNLPVGLAIDPAKGLIQGKIACGTAGTYQVTVTASDGSLADSEAFTWQVLPAECVVKQEVVYIPVLLNRP